ncbi:MATE family efflux transporter [Adlercreutzia sp. ZJ473]|uniref:MATE family efflux transporter n=1 Tax=Adlercreutzia sp. ZJ473 TaxID=2722822 RepID=UPI00155633FC|nr:MATE family efflux transporter [Adlercreutzia sp. ZJ473]
MAVDMGRHFSMPQLLRYAAPSIAMMIFTSVYGIVDGLFVSNFAGKTALAAVNWAMPILMVLSSVGFMIGAGGSAIVAKTRGERDDERANRYFSLLVYATLAIGVALAVAGAFVLRPLYQLMGASGEMLELAVVYGLIALLSFPFFMLQYVFQSFFVVAGKPQLGFCVVVAAGVANMALDALFVGVLGWGVAGASLATSIGEFIGGGVPLLYFARKNASFLRLGRTRFEGRVLARACVNGSSEMVSNIAMSLVAMLYNFQLLRLIGEDGVAAYGVIMYVAMVFGAMFMGYAMGTSPLMSFQLGARNHVEMRSLFRKSMAFVAAGGVCMFALAQASAGALAQVFVGYDPELCALTERAFRIYALTYLLMGFCVYGSALFTALNNGLVSAAISFLRTLVFEVAAVLLLPLVLGPQGIWFATPAAELVALVVTLAFMLGLGDVYGFMKPRPGKARRKRPRPRA